MFIQKIIFMRFIVSVMFLNHLLFYDHAFYFIKFFRILISRLASYSRQSLLTRLLLQQDMDS